MFELSSLSFFESSVLGFFFENLNSFRFLFSNTLRLSPSCLVYFQVSTLFPSFVYYSSGFISSSFLTKGELEREERIYVVCSEYPV